MAYSNLEIEQFITNHLGYFSERQSELDNHIRDKKGISLEDWQNDLYYDQSHYIALKNEVNEFINECRDIWKYWKDKPVDNAKLIDEFVDIIHFSVLIFNKTFLQKIKDVSDVMDVIYPEIQKRTVILSTFINPDGDSKLDQSQALNVLYRLESSNDILDIMVYGLIIMMGYYGYTGEQIKQAYDVKNKINFDRQNNGW